MRERKSIPQFSLFHSSAIFPVYWRGLSLSRCTELHFLFVCLGKYFSLSLSCFVSLSRLLKGEIRPQWQLDNCELRIDSIAANKADVHELPLSNL